MKANEVVDAVLAEHSLSEIISESLTLEKKGNSHVGLCPFHEDSHPSFSISDAKQVFNCFSCGAKGGLAQFIMRFYKKDYSGSLNYLAQKYNLDFETQNHSEEQFSDAQLVLLEANAIALSYFKNRLIENYQKPFIKEFLSQRHLDIKKIKKFNLGYDDGELYKYLQKIAIDLDPYFAVSILGQKEKRLYDRYYRRIIFPIYDSNTQIRGFSARSIDAKSSNKYLNSAESSIFKKNELFFNLQFGLQQAKIKGAVILVEGQMDAISLDGANIENVLAIMGTSLSEKHLELLQELKVYLFFDQDKAGQEAVIKHASKLLAFGFEVFVVQAKKTKKVFSQRTDFDHLFTSEALNDFSDKSDPDELVLKYGKTLVEELIKTSKSAIDFYYLHLRVKYDFQNSNNITQFSKEFSLLLQYQEQIIIDFYKNLLEKNYGINLKVQKRFIKKIRGQKNLYKNFKRYDESVNYLQDNSQNDYQSAPNEEMVFATLPEEMLVEPPEVEGEISHQSTEKSLDFMKDNKINLLAIRIFVSLLESETLLNKYFKDDNLVSYWRHTSSLLKNINQKIINFAKEYFDNRPQKSILKMLFLEKISPQEREWFSQNSLFTTNKTYLVPKKYEDIENLVFSLHKLSISDKIKYSTNEFVKQPEISHEKILAYANFRDLKQDETNILLEKLIIKNRRKDSDEKK